LFLASSPFAVFKQAHKTVRPLSQSAIEVVHTHDSRELVSARAFFQGLRTGVNGPAQPAAATVAAKPARRRRAKKGNNPPTACDLFKKDFFANNVSCALSRCRLIVCSSSVN
jgi:hypothetical protein